MTSDQSMMIPWGVSNPEAYLAGKAAARMYALSHGFEEPTFVEIPVQWGEQDANNHLNNVTFMRYCEAGRLAFTRALTADLSPEARSQLHQREGKGRGMILAGVSISYERVVFSPDTVLVAHKHSTVGTKRILLESLIYSFNQQARVATGTAAMVAYDYSAGRSINLPEEVVTLLQEKGRKREEVKARMEAEQKRGSKL